MTTPAQRVPLRRCSRFGVSSLGIELSRADLGSVVTVQEVDLGLCGGQFFPGDPDRAGILLPGARYLPAAPLLWFAREALQAQGWSVLQVWDEWDRSVDAPQWVSERLEAALSHVGAVPTRLLIAKSLTSLALSTAVERGLPGVWLTPLLGQDEVRSALEASRAPTLAVGGTADPTWDAQFVAGLTNIEVVEIVGADHALQQPGDPAKSIESLRTITERVLDFVSRLR